ncbi:hypothetical protein GcM3_152013 [Golovinomyces cichoracearum]|uniref:Uncharacterized protein n=1 Tax=Golovinomyces cichoracearum TaxID=62708 RepID=A0A420HWP9_9PEZI|nr:hypothetical protein GcM3_152013 [Golovinomyces cichoracearum]
MHINKLLDQPGENGGLISPLIDDAIIKQFCEPADKNEEGDDSKLLPNFYRSDVQLWLQNIQLFIMQLENMDLIVIEQLTKMQEKYGSKSKARRSA